MSKLIRNTSDAKSAAFWRSVEESAAELRDAPSWMKAGIVLDPRHYETFPPVEDFSVTPKPPRK